MRWRGMTVTAVLVGGLVQPPAGAAYDDVEPISHAGEPATAMAAATDREGETTYLYVTQQGDRRVLTVRTRGADGRLGPALQVGSISEDDAFNDVAMDVDDEGNGIVVWGWEPLSSFMEGYLSARQFTADGQLGPLLQPAPPEHYVTITEVAVAPAGQAVVTWDDTTGNGYVPYVRSVTPEGDMGPIQRTGRGPDAHAPLIAMERSGRATLVWTNGKLLARHLSPSGDLSPLRTVRRPAREDEALTVTEVGVDRRGIVSVACNRRSPNTLFLPEDDSYVRACMLRISPRLRLLDRVRTLSPRDVEVDDGGVRVGVAPSGRAVVGWQRRSFDGAWVHRVGRGGTPGQPIKVGTGGIEQIALTGDGDGVVASTNRGSDGLYRIIKATQVRDGRIRSGEIVATNDADTRQVFASLGAEGRAVLAWEEVLEQRFVMAAER